MTKPNWKDAPLWAQWLAQDSNGAWYWYENEPQQSVLVWLPQSTQYEYVKPELSLNWRESLEQRPAVQ